MRTDRLRRAAAALAVAAACASAAAAARAEDGHDHGTHAPEVALSDLTQEQRNAVLDAWTHVVCACPKENWSRTLANCPDGCALRQKQQVMRGVVAGQDLAAILADQVKEYGPKAAADPGFTSNGTILVLAGVGLGAVFAGIVLSRWRRGAEERRLVSDEARRRNPEEDAEVEAVERELREIE